MPMPKYDLYVEACEAEGVTPLLRDEWMNERRAAGREAAKTTAAVAEPEPSADGAGQEPPAPPVVAAEQLRPEEITHLNFCAPQNRFRTEIMQAGGRTVIDGSMAVRPHVTIEFTEYHWVAELADPDQKTKAEWLLKSKAFQKGEIILVPAVRPPRQVAIQTGPRTSSSSRAGHEDVPAVLPPPNVAAALSASMTP